MILDYQSFVNTINGVLDYMKMNGINCDAITLNTMMRVHARARNLNELQSLFDSFEQLNLKRDVITYTIIISYYAKEPLPTAMSEAENLFKKMVQEERIEPDLYVWCALLTSYANNCEMNKLYKALMLMENQGIYPTSNIFRKILDSISNVPFDLQKKAKKLKILVDKMSRATKSTSGENLIKSRYNKQDPPKKREDLDQFDVTKWAEI